MKDLFSTLFEGKFKSDLVMLGYPAVSLSSSDYFLHEFPIAVNVDYCSPLFNPKYENLHFDSGLEVVLLGDGEVFKLKYCCLSSFHTGDEGFDVEVVFSNVVFDSFCVHEVKGVKVRWISLLPVVFATVFLLIFIFYIRFFFRFFLLD